MLRPPFKRFCRRSKHLITEFGPDRSLEGSSVSLAVARVAGVCEGGRVKGTHSAARGKAFAPPLSAVQTTQKPPTKSSVRSVCLRGSPASGFRHLYLMQILCQSRLLPRHSRIIVRLFIFLSLFCAVRRPSAPNISSALVFPRMLPSTAPCKFAKIRIIAKAELQQPPSAGILFLSYNRGADHEIGR